MDALAMDDPIFFKIEDCQISSSQEEILRDCPFFGQPVNSPGDGVLPTLPETAQDTGQDRGSLDVFITPPGKQSSAFDFRPCGCHKAVQTDDQTLGFDDFTGHADVNVYVDLNDDSDLGFPLAELNLMTDRTMVAGCSRGNDGAGVPEISNLEIDEFQVSGRELSSKDSIGEPPHKRMKTSEQNPGSKSSQACSGIEPQKIGDNFQHCEGKLVSPQKRPCNFAADPQPQQNIQIGKEMPLGVRDQKTDFAGISVEENLGYGENRGSHVTQSEIAISSGEVVENIESRGRNPEAEKLTCAGKGKKVNESAETPENKGRDEQQKLRMLLPSIAGCLKDMANGKNENEKSVSFVFDVLKSLTKEASEKKDSLENVSWLELAKSKGITFPTPWWRMETNT